jgi:glycosyltransferase involved in cell wall biosynthesis
VVSDAIYPYHKGGKEVRYHHICPRLARSGFDVQVFTMHWWKGSRRREEDGVRYHAVSRLVPLYVGERRSVLQAALFSIGCLRLLGHRFDAIEADQMPYLPLFPLRLVATIKRVPLVVTWHEVWGAAYWREYMGAFGVVGAALERLAMHTPDLIVAENDETRRRLLDAGLPAARVTVVPNGVDMAVIAAAAPAATTFDLIYVGRLLGHKRVDDLLTAVDRLGREGVPLTCAIVGVGPERERLEELASELDISEQVRFFGSLEQHADVYGLIKSSGVFVLPSVREGFGIVVVEALACGIPVITTDHPDNQARLLVEDGVTGWLCRPSGDGLAEAIRQSRRGQADLTRAAATLGICDWDRIVDRLAGLYETGSLVAAGARPA